MTSSNSNRPPPEVVCPEGDLQSPELPVLGQDILCFLQVEQPSSFDYDVPGQSQANGLCLPQDVSTTGNVLLGNGQHTPPILQNHTGFTELPNMTNNNCLPREPCGILEEILKDIEKSENLKGRAFNQEIYATEKKTDVCNQNLVNDDPIQTKHYEQETVCANNNRERTSTKVVTEALLCQDTGYQDLQTKIDAENKEKAFYHNEVDGKSQNTKSLDAWNGQPDVTKHPTLAEEGISEPNMSILSYPLPDNRPALVETQQVSVSIQAGVTPQENANYIPDIDHQDPFMQIAPGPVASMTGIQDRSPAYDTSMAPYHHPLHPYHRQCEASALPCPSETSRAILGNLNLSAASQTMPQPTNHGLTNLFNAPPTTPYPPQLPNRTHLQSVNPHAMSNRYHSANYLLTPNGQLQHARGQMVQGSPTIPATVHPTYPPQNYFSIPTGQPQAHAVSQQCVPQPTIRMTGNFYKPVQVPNLPAQPCQLYQHKQVAPPVTDKSEPLLVSQPPDVPQAISARGYVYNKMSAQSTRKRRQPLAPNSSNKKRNIAEGQNKIPSEMSVLEHSFTSGPYSSNFLKRNHRMKYHLVQSGFALHREDRIKCCDASCGMEHMIPGVFEEKAKSVMWHKQGCRFFPAKIPCRNCVSWNGLCCGCEMCQ